MSPKLYQKWTLKGGTSVRDVFVYFTSKTKLFKTSKN